MCRTVCRSNRPAGSGEAAREHRVERGDVVALCRPVERGVVFGTDLVTELRPFRQNLVCRGSIATAARRDELIDWQDRARRAVRQ
jgi:hypothetical protein